MASDANGALYDSDVGHSDILVETSAEGRERDRMAAVRRYQILDTPPDGTFDRITRLAAAVFGVPIAIVSIVDEDRIWFKSAYGLDLTEIPRHPGLCASAVLQLEPHILADARLDPVALTNPLVAGEFGLRFYAAAPLVISGGHSLGTLCVLDFEPRQLSAAERSTLQDFSALVVAELELRLEARTAIAEHQLLREQALGQQRAADELAEVLQASLVPSRLPTIPGLDLAACYQPANQRMVGGDFYDIFPLTRQAWGVALGDVCGKGPRAASVTAAARYALRAASTEHAKPSDVLQVLNDTLLLDDSDDPSFCTLIYGRLSRFGAGFRVTVASGGHPLPQVLRRHGAIERLGSFGSLVGCLPVVEFTDATVTLRPGDAVVFYTDGLTEARSGSDMLGVDGISEVLATCRGLSAAAITELLRSAALDSGRLQRDDLAILVIKVDGDPPTAPVRR
jgi:sigma-B regulation protein RsbU (phosphoserine phosphatase)